MSYVRWGEDGSSVYLYADSAGHVTCCACGFEYRETAPWVNFFGDTMTFEVGNAELHSPAEVIGHLQRHRDNGDTVPAWLFDEALYQPADFLPYRAPDPAVKPEPAAKSGVENR